MRADLFFFRGSMAAPIAGRSLVAIASCVISLFDSLPALAEETLKFAFDGRRWTVGENRETSNESITEWVLPGERVTNWQELVTLQSFWGFQNRLSVEHYLERTGAAVARRCTGATFEIIRRADSEAIYASSCPQPAESTLHRVMFGREAIHVLQYAHKGAPFDDLKKALWLPLLERAVLVDR